MNRLPVPGQPGCGPAGRAGLRLRKRPPGPAGSRPESAWRHLDAAGGRCLNEGIFQRFRPLSIRSNHHAHLVGAPGRPAGTRVRKGYCRARHPPQRFKTCRGPRRRGPARLGVLPGGPAPDPGRRRDYNISWYEQLRSALNSNGYSAVQIVGADSDWSIASDIASNSTFASSVGIVGVHYPCQGGDGGSAATCPGNSTATGTGKPLWASENGSQDLNTGAPALIRRVRRPVHRRRARVGHRRQHARVRAPVRPAVRHHPRERQLLAHRAAGLHLHADHHQRAGQGHRGQPGPGDPAPAVLRQLRQRHGGPAAAR